LEQINELLQCWDISKYDYSVREEYHKITRELDRKMSKLELRKTYTKILRAKDENARHDARMQYLWQKNQIKCGNDDFEF
jgi:hypothetical protein